MISLQCKTKKSSVLGYHAVSHDRSLLMVTSAFWNNKLDTSFPWITDIAWFGREGRMICLPILNFMDWCLSSGPLTLFTLATVATLFCNHTKLLSPQSHVLAVASARDSSHAQIPDSFRSLCKCHLLREAFLLSTFSKIASPHPCLFPYPALFFTSVCMTA